jgi:hypothetical protein
MCDNQFQCETKDCFYCLQHDIAGEIFRTIESQQEGEAGKAWYCKKLLDEDCLHNEVEYYLEDMSDEECEKHIYKYGFHKALIYYTNKFGTITPQEDVNVCKTLLYVLVCEDLDVSYDDYKEWCEEHCDCDENQEGEA